MRDTLLDVVGILTRFAPAHEQPQSAAMVSQMIRKRVIACMWKLRQRELVREVAMEGELKG